ncbi:MAG: type II secretion system F family protein [Eubacteriales bacterium]|nr:type II secretion system F family protein [Eubacteriales bacterium]
MHRLAEKLLSVIPDSCCGKTAIMKEKYSNRYGQRDCNVLVHNARLRTAKAYLVLIILFIPLFTVSLAGFITENTAPQDLKRPAYGEADRIEKLKAMITYEDTIIEKDVEIRIPSRELTENQKKEMIKKYGEELKHLILGENPDLNNITTDLFLPETDKKNKIQIRWMSDAPDLLNEEGELDSIKAKGGGQVILTAQLSLDGITDEVSFNIRVPVTKTTEHSRALENRLAREIENMKEEMAINSILPLPEELEEGIQIQWKKKRQSPLFELIILFSFGFLIIFFKRFDQIERQFKTDKETIIKDFPDFIDKLVLLLNAGLVTDAALEKIAFDYRKNQKGLKNNSLYEGVCEIEKRMKETNAPLAKELREFAQKSGVRELMRFAVIVEDNIYKGSTLVEKLEGEAELLWLSKKKRAEEKGRLVETKLIFPLVLLLFVLILITISPIMINI